MTPFVLQAVELLWLVSLVFGFGSYGISVALSEREGPYSFLTRLRQEFSVVECPYCSGFWICLALWLIAGNFAISWFLVPFGVLASWGIQTAMLTISGK
jgi:hypothetical protein